MRTMSVIAAVAVLATVAACVFTQTPSKAAGYRQMCFNTGQSVYGQYRTCYYSCPGGPVAISIPAYEICPVTITN